MTSTSGFISQALNIGGLISDLLGSSVLSLGGFSFQNFEIPASVQMGNAQQLTTHKLPGGGRVVDAMGKDDAVITWSGIFLSVDAFTRAQTLRQMCDDGSSVPLSIASLSYNVIVQNIELTVHQVNYIEYHIACVVLSDTSGSGPPGLLSGILNDVGSALGISSGFVSSAMSTVTSAINTVSPVLSAVTTLTGGSSAALGALSALTTAQSTIGAVQGTANGLITSFSSFTSGSGPLAAAQSLMSTSTALGDAAGATTVLGYVGRSIKNLVNT